MLESRFMYIKIVVQIFLFLFKKPTISFKKLKVDTV